MLHFEMLFSSGKILSGVLKKLIYTVQLKKRIIKNIKYNKKFPTAIRIALQILLSKE